MTKKIRIHKYPPEFADVGLGEYWLVQIEPITINTCPKLCKIVEITDTTVVLLFTGAVNPTRYAYFAVRFMEKLVEKADD
jgi:hypothetical protein